MKPTLIAHSIWAAYGRAPMRLLAPWHFMPGPAAGSLILCQPGMWVAHVLAVKP